MKELEQFRKLAGIRSLTERKSWTLAEAPPTFEVGEMVVSAGDAGIDSNKKGKVLAIDDGWAQIETADEVLWLPNSKLSPVQNEEKLDEGHSHIETLIPGIERQVDEAVWAVSRGLTDLQKLLSALHAALPADAKGARGEVGSSLATIRKMQKEISDIDPTGAVEKALHARED